MHILGLFLKLVEAQIKETRNEVEVVEVVIGGSNSLNTEVHKSQFNVFHDAPHL